ncbi:phosphoribosylformylglycinamidine synthase [Phosphitispora fastidiosa]|uniref:phosphoribosylformylglycinamidine synthase n=1 Tax=Phosphitispora fastidiosa TaxID=2837202 RepID=UPI001E503F89|nr:phosphoribosylformylglycinamidine synthase [Phosphitispora fastidiosa]MBU7008516.1 phosphoribosylformylglycinamidine synthase [Phosphitispora fastidiosa]
MNTGVRRIYVEKKQGFDVEARSLLADLRENLGLRGLETVRVINRYDVSGITDEEYQKARTTIFSEPPVDNVYDETFPEPGESSRVFAMEYLPGQYDQRADSAAQCLQLLSQKEKPAVSSARVVVLGGALSDADFTRIKSYCINPVDSREASLDKPQRLDIECAVPADVEVVAGFISKSEAELQEFFDSMGFAMSFGDLKFLKQYYRDTEHRDPTVTELRVIDTYWSDHCRHTTFLTELHEVSFEPGAFTVPVENAYREYLQSREYVYGSAVNQEKDICLMDLALMAMKELRKSGKLTDLDESDEINACSIAVNVDVNGKDEEWLVMFKNETHNHPTEIEPFGGAATCLGGAIRDPLSGRSYVYQAMRVTGSGDPRVRIEDTLPGKLPQRKITTEAAAGYSSYGNQIGLATGQVAEVYDAGFLAKRMEIGAVIGAAPKRNVVREAPVEGDLVILVGGRTGRDGCGGATGSSKEHDEESILTCGAEVQKGNPPEERKIQRLFRDSEVSTMIKRCNDFGAGGVSVAIGELTDGLEINLDAVPKKYEGLDGTELAISESQERMAVVVAAVDADSFISRASRENLEATVVARVTADRRLKMSWRGRNIVDISRDFLNTNGVKQNTTVRVAAPKENGNFFHVVPNAAKPEAGSLKKAWLANLRELNVCGQKGLVEMFDSTIGAGSVLLPFGGRYQLTPAEGMAAKIPLVSGETKSGTLMAFGYNPKLVCWSPFHGALYAVVEAVTRIAALGGDYSRVRLTLQEYFEKLGSDPVKWGKPFSALLGAFYAQKMFGIAAIGGKDSMSGTFKDLNVPPTLVAFAMDMVNVERVVSQEFKKTGSRVVLVPASRDKNEIPDFDRLKQNFTKIYQLIQQGHVLASHSVRAGGLAEAISKMCFGNKIGFEFAGTVSTAELFTPDYGSVVLEINAGVDINKVFGDVPFRELGQTTEKPAIKVSGAEAGINNTGVGFGNAEIGIDEAVENWMAPLERVFPTRVTGEPDFPKPAAVLDNRRNTARPGLTVARPRVFIPVFPGTNCEYDSARAFERAGGAVETLVIRNLTPEDIELSVDAMAKGIDKAQIIMIPGGFSAGDEPDGSGKFIATAFRNPRVRDAVMNLLKNRDGLMLGICNGFQALIKLGLVPYGEITDMGADCPTLTFNTIGRHASCMVRTKVVSTLSPWFANANLGDIHTIPISHGEGRFVAGEEQIRQMIANGQVATQYVDPDNNPTYDIAYNPNGSVDAIEGITSPDGRVLGKMGHSERIGSNVAVNVPGEKNQQIFESGVKYFR